MSAASRRLSTVAVGLLVAGLGGEARAQPPMTPSACIQANEQAGPLRRAGKLRESRGQLRLCSAEGCPMAVRKDCIAGAAQADAEVPTVTFSAQDPDGNDVSAVSVSVDGELIASKLDGKAVEVDPGEHVFRFQTTGQPVIEKRLLIVQAEKNRRERVQFGEMKVGPRVAPVPVVVAQRPPAAPAATSRSRGIGIAVGGAGLALLAVGGVAGLVATLEWSATKTACGPTFPQSCSATGRGAATSDQSATLVASTIADVALGLGAAGVIAGAVLILGAPAPGAPPTSARLVLSPQIGPASEGLLLRGSF